MTTIDFKFFHRSSICDNVWMDFEPIHSFFTRIMLGQFFFLYCVPNLKFFHGSCHKQTSE
jgi:hypothetical protein